MAIGLPSAREGHADCRPQTPVLSKLTTGSGERGASSQLMFVNKNPQQVTAKTHKKQQLRKTSSYTDSVLLLYLVSVGNADSHGILES